MADFESDVELGEVLLILGVVGVGGYLAYKGVKGLADYFKPGGGATCITKVGAVPGIIGATQSQVDAAKIAAQKLPVGGKVIWSCCSDSLVGGNSFDYQNPDGSVTIARRNPFNLIWPWADVMTYETVSWADYQANYAHCSQGVNAPASAVGKPGCQNPPNPSCSICECSVCSVLAGSGGGGF